MKSKIAAATTLNPDGIPGGVAFLDWKSIAADLNGHGCTVLDPLITHEQCVELVACYETSIVQSDSEIRQCSHHRAPRAAAV
jgi:hypothetical protein